MAATSSTRSESPAEIDFSVIRTSINMGHKQIDQILNGIHYGSDEVRHLLREECDFIMECKVCRNLFRSFPNFVAHKRVYCREYYEEKVESEKMDSQPTSQETVIIQPEAPEDSRKNAENGQNKIGSTTQSNTDKVISNTFEGKSKDYQFYTKVAEEVERRKLTKVSNTVTLTSIPTNANAVTMSVSKGENSNESASTSSPKKQSPVKSNTPYVPSASVLKQKMSVLNICSNLAKKKVADEQERSKSSTAGVVSLRLSQRHRKSSPRKSLDYVDLTRKVSKNKSNSLIETNEEPESMEWTEEESSESLNDPKNKWLKLCDSKNLKCRVCDQKFSSLNKLHFHVKIKHVNEASRYHCPSCHLSYEHFKSLARHLRTIHQKSESIINMIKNKHVQKSTDQSKQNKFVKKPDSPHKPSGTLVSQNPPETSVSQKPSENLVSQKLSETSVSQKPSGTASLAKKKVTDEQERSKSSTAGVVSLRLSQRQRKSSPRKSLDYVDLTRKVSQNKSISPIETNEEAEAMEWTDEEASESLNMLNDPMNEWLKLCDAKNMKCRVCDQKFSSLNKLHFHVKIKHVNEASRYHCPSCHLSYEHFRSLARHLRTIHNKPESLINMIKNKHAQRSTDQIKQNTFIKKPDSPHKPLVSQNPPETSASQKPAETSDSQKPSGTFVSLSTGWKKCDKCGKVCWKAKSFYRHYSSCKGASNKTSPASSKAGSPVKQDKPTNEVQRHSTALLRLEEKLRAGVSQSGMENTQSTTRSRSDSRERKSLEKSIESKTSPNSELCKALSVPPLNVIPKQKLTEDASTLKEAVQNKALSSSTSNINENERQNAENLKKIAMGEEADSNIEMDYETNGSPGFKELQEKLTREAGLQQPSTDKNSDSEAKNRPYGTRLSSQKKEIPKVNDTDTPSRKIRKESDKEGSLLQDKGQRMQRETVEMKELELKLTRKALGHNDTERKVYDDENVDAQQKEFTKISDNLNNRADTNTDRKKICSTEIQTVKSPVNKLAEEIDQTSEEAKRTKTLKRSVSRDASSRRQLVAENLREKMEEQASKISNKSTLSRSVSHESVARKQSISERTPEKLHVNIDKTPISSPRRPPGLPVSPTPSNQSASGDGYNLKFKMTVKEMAELVETASLTKFAKDRKKRARKILNKKQVKEAQKVSVIVYSPVLRQKTKQVNSNKVPVNRTRSRSVENKQPVTRLNNYSLRATGSSDETKSTSSPDTKKVDSLKEKTQENTKLSREQKRLQNSEGFVEKNYYSITTSRESSKDWESEDSEKRRLSRERYKTENSSERNLSYESDTSVGSSKRLASWERRRTENPSVRSLYYESDTSVNSSVSKSSEKVDKDFLDKRSRADKHITRELKRLEASAGFVDKTSGVTHLTFENVQAATNKGEQSIGSVQHAEDISHKERLKTRELKRLEASPGFVDKTSNVPLIVSENVQTISKGEKSAGPIHHAEELSQKERIIRKELKRLEATPGFVDKNSNVPLLKSPVQTETTKAEMTTGPIHNAEEITQKEKHQTRELKRLEASPGFVDKNADAQLESAEGEPTRNTKTKRNLQMETVRIEPANVPSKEASPSLKVDQEIIILDDDNEVIILEDGKEDKTLEDGKEIEAIEDDKDIIILDDDKSLDMQPKTDVTTRKMTDKVDKSYQNVNSQQGTSTKENERSKESKKAVSSKQINNSQEKHKIEASLKSNPLKRKATDSVEMVPETQVQVVKELNLKHKKAGKATNKTDSNELAKTVRSEKKVHNVEKLQTIASKHVLKIKERFFQIKDIEPSPAKKTETAETRKLQEIEKEIAIGLSKAKPSTENLQVVVNKQKRERQMKPIVLTVNRDIGAYLKAFCNTPAAVRYDVYKKTESSETKKSTEVEENQVQVKSTPAERRSTVGSSIYGITVGLTKTQAQNIAKKDGSITNSAVDNGNSKITPIQDNTNSHKEQANKGKPDSQNEPNSSEEISTKSDLPKHRTRLATGSIYFDSELLKLSPFKAGKKVAEQGKTEEDTGKTGTSEGLTLVKKRLTLSPKKNEQEMKAKHSRTQSTPLRYSLETGVKQCEKCGKTFWKKKAFVFHMKNSMCSDKRSSKTGVKRPRSPQQEENKTISVVRESKNISSKKPRLDDGNFLSNKDANFKSNKQEVSNKSIPIETTSTANEQIGKETVEGKHEMKESNSFNLDKGEDNKMCHRDKDANEMDTVDVKTKQRNEETPGPSTSQLVNYGEDISDDDNGSDFSGFSEDDLKISEQELSQINTDEQSDIKDDVEDVGSSEGGRRPDATIDLDPEPTKQLGISAKGKRPVRKSAQNRFGHVEEIWVYKEPGKPVEMEKQKFVKNREYVVDVKNPSKLHCHNIKDVDKLIDEEKLKCKQCDTPCTSISNLRRHVIRHLGWKRYKCKHCAYTCYDMSYCRQHVLRAHNDSLNSKNFNKYIMDLKKEATKKRAAKRTVTLYKTKQNSQDSEVYKKPKAAATNEIVADTDKHIPINRRPLFKKSPGHTVDAMSDKTASNLSEVQKSAQLVSPTTEKTKEPKKVSVADFIGKPGTTEQGVVHQNVSKTGTVETPEKSLTPLSRARMILTKALGD